MSEYSSAIDLAARLIIKKGREVIFRYLETDTQLVDPDEPWDKPAPLKADQKLKMVFLDYDQEVIDGTTIKTKDKQVLMFAKGVKHRPNSKCKLIVPAKGVTPAVWWNIIDFETIEPGDVPVMFILQVRR